MLLHLKLCFNLKQSYGRCKQKHKWQLSWLQFTIHSGFALVVVIALHEIHRKMLYKLVASKLHIELCSQLGIP